MTHPHITDSHCHLDFPDFEGQLDQVIQNAKDAGVARMVTICTKLRNEPSVRAIAEAHAPVFYAAGTHPMSVADEPMATVEELVALAKHPKFVGIGETGLDYHYTGESADVQKRSLHIHIEAARETGLPLITQSGRLYFVASHKMRGKLQNLPAHWQLEDQSGNPIMTGFHNSGGQIDLKPGSYRLTATDSESGRTQTRRIQVTNGGSMQITLMFP